MNKHLTQIQQGAKLVRDKAKLEQSIGSKGDQLKLDLKHKQESLTNNPWDEEIDQVVVTCGALAAEAQAAQVKLDAIDEELRHVSFWREFFSKELKLQLFESIKRRNNEYTTYEDFDQCLWEDMIDDARERRRTREERSR